jgi:hypothetical protein
MQLCIIAFSAVSCLSLRSASEHYVTTTAETHIVVLQVMAPCSAVDGQQRFCGKYSPRMEAVCSCEKLVPTTGLYDIITQTTSV